MTKLDIDGRTLNQLTALAQVGGGSLDAALRRAVDAEVARRLNGHLAPVITLLLGGFVAEVVDDGGLPVLSLGTDAVSVAVRPPAPPTGGDMPHADQFLGRVAAWHERFQRQVYDR